jgi:hypothetical protein
MSQPGILNRGTKGRRGEEAHWPTSGSVKKEGFTVRSCLPLCTDQRIAQMYSWNFIVRFLSLKFVNNLQFRLIFLRRNTNKMQLCTRIYYSKVYWRLNMFRAAHRSSSGAPNCICSLWFIYTCGDQPLSRLSGKSHSTLTTAGHHMCI